MSDDKPNEQDEQNETKDRWLYSPFLDTQPRWMDWQRRVGPSEFTQDAKDALPRRPLKPGQKSRFVPPVTNK